MKRFKKVIAAALVFSLTGCFHQGVHLEIEPAQVEEFYIGTQSTLMDSLPAGSYRFRLQEGEAANVRYYLYVSTDVYNEVNAQLRSQLAAVVCCGQPAVLTLEEGHYLYISPVRDTTGLFEEGLIGTLDIDAS